jgi:hypothetical protein
MEAIPSSGTLAHTKSTLRRIPEDGILHSHRRESLKSYKVLGVLVSLEMRNLFSPWKHIFIFKYINPLKTKYVLSSI